MIFLKDIVNRILKEGPEEFRDINYCNGECMGPFIVAYWGGSYHWIFGSQQNELIVDDNLIDTKYSGYQTHEELSKKVKKIFRVDVNRHSENKVKSVDGRIYNDDGKFIVSSWSTREEILKYGMHNFLNGVDEILNTVGGNSKTAWYNPFDDVDKDKSYTYDQFKTGHQTIDTDTITRNDRELLHLLDPSRKGAALRLMGAKPKTQIEPDFIKKQRAGIDEVQSQSIKK